MRLPRALSPLARATLVAALAASPLARAAASDLVAFTSEVMPTYNVAVTRPPKPPVRPIEELRREKVDEIRGTVPAEDAAAAGVTVGPTGSVAWAVRKEDRALRAALDLHLANVRKSASWNLLLVKYFGEQAPLVLGRRR